MTIAYVTTNEAQPAQVTYVTRNESQPAQVTYVTAGPAPLPPQATYVQVRTRRPTKQNAHTATSGILLFAYGGMDMAQGLGWNISTDLPTTSEMQYSWFIGVIIGAFVAGLSITHIPKWVFYTLGGLMQLIDGIIFVSTSEYTSLLAARYVGGIGIGLLTVTFIIHNSEITMKNSRGLWCGLEQYSLALGIAIQVILDTQMDTSSGVGINCAHGIFGIVFSLVATAFVVVSIESPIFYLRKNNEEQALTQLKMLYAHSGNAEIYNEALDEAKRYVATAASQSTGAQLAASVMPFVKMLFSRCLVPLTFSLPLSYSMITSTVVAELALNWPIIVWGLLRWFGTFFSMALLDTVGRKFVSLLGLLCMAGLMLGMAGIYSDTTRLISTYYMSQVSRLSMAFQFFAGLYISCTPTYLGEAFPLKVKYFLIGLIVCLEQVIHIIVIETCPMNVNVFYQYFLAVGIILVVCLIIFAVLMPETRGLSLRQATERFNRVHDVMAH
ncbi:PREDICTED: major myo-inositol transporter IolT-like [Drosophila arizonae]|uniref:Major myo-inositol transporter IolT-like n=1 Tax=Drosophila arizonae TaxID=7263 RepID=A0ABM1Q5G5_DROAR|nr:PREDICTED: major myo-inositol transporter IolT-like [Drosophila arizonae]